MTFLIFKIAAGGSYDPAKIQEISFKGGLAPCALNRTGLNWKTTVHSCVFNVLWSFILFFAEVEHHTNALIPLKTIPILNRAVSICGWFLELCSPIQVNVVNSTACTVGSGQVSCRMQWS